MFKCKMQHTDTLDILEGVYKSENAAFNDALKKLKNKDFYGNYISFGDKEIRMLSKEIVYINNNQQ